ncbi:MAG: ATP-binding protein [Ferruginibacter sp.]
MLKKIVIIGPESTGKSTLSLQLAEHYKTYHVEEYAREYLETNGKEYTYDDLLKISEGQIKLEEIETEKLKKDKINSSLLFIDTDSYVIKVWSEFVFNKCDNRILNNIASRKYDLYLLCNTDLPWTADKLREYPDLKIRNKIYHYYKDAMINQKTPWVEISGDYNQRFNIAIKAVDNLLLNL